MHRLHLQGCNCCLQIIYTPLQGFNAGITLTNTSLIQQSSTSTHQNIQHLLYRKISVQVPLPAQLQIHQSTKYCWDSAPASKATENNFRFS